MSESTWLILDRCGVIVGLFAFVGTAYSAYKWVRHGRRERVLDQAVRVSLTDASKGATRYELPFVPARRIVTRAEVLGLLGMIPSSTPGNRYDWRWLHTPDFMRHLEEIFKGQRHTLEIPVSDEEFAQLDLTPSSGSVISANPDSYR